MIGWSSTSCIQPAWTGKAKNAIFGNGKLKFIVWELILRFPQGIVIRDFVLFQGSGVRLAFSIWNPFSKGPFQKIRCFSVGTRYSSILDPSISVRLCVLALSLGIVFINRRGFDCLQCKTWEFYLCWIVRERTRWECLQSGPRCQKRKV